MSTGPRPIPNRKKAKEHVPGSRPSSHVKEYKSIRPAEQKKRVYCDKCIMENVEDHVLQVSGAVFGISVYACRACGKEEYRPLDDLYTACEYSFYGNLTMN